jgi:hypothetical protein
MHATGKPLDRGFSVPQDRRKREKIFRSLETLIFGDLEKENSDK